MDKDKYIDWFNNNYADLVEEWMNMNEEIKEQFEDWSIMSYTEEQVDRAEMLRDGIITEEMLDEA